MWINLLQSTDNSDTIIDESIITDLINSTGLDNLPSQLYILKSMCPSDNMMDKYNVYYQPYSDKNISGTICVTDQNSINGLITYLTNNGIIN